MDDNLLSAVVDLPVEMQQMIVQEKVKQDKSISLTNDNLQQGLDALVSPFANAPGLPSIAKTEVLRVNHFTLSALSSIVTWQDSIPSILSTTTGQVLTHCPEIRHLEILVPNTLEGCNFNMSHPIRLSAGTTTLFSVLPTIFPRLDTINFKVINVGLVASGAAYTKWHLTRPADACAGSQAREKASRMYQLLRAAHETVFPLWKRNSPVNKSLVFVQSIPHGTTGKGPRVKVKSGPNSFHNANNTGMSPNTGKRVWALCDWPLARVEFV